MANIKYGDTGYIIDYLQFFLKENYSDSVVVSGVYDKSTHKNLIAYLELPETLEPSGLLNTIIQQCPGILDYFKVNRTNSTINFESVNAEYATVNYANSIYDKIKFISENNGWHIKTYTNYRLNSKEKFRIFLQKSRDNKLPNSDMLSMVNKFDGTYYYNYTIDKGDHVQYEAGCGYKLAVIKCKPNTEYTICHAYDNIIPVSICSYPLKEFKNNKPVSKHISTYINRTGKLVYKTDSDAQNIIIQVPYVIKDKTEYPIRLRLGDADLDGKLTSTDVLLLKRYLFNPISLKVFSKMPAIYSVEPYSDIKSLGINHFTVTNKNGVNGGITDTFDANLNDVYLYGYDNRQDSIDLTTGKVVTYSKLIEFNKINTYTVSYVNGTILIEADDIKFDSRTLGSHFDKKKLSSVNGHIAIKDDRFKSIEDFNNFIDSEHNEHRNVCFIYETANASVLNTDVIKFLKSSESINIIACSQKNTNLAVSYFSGFNANEITEKSEFNSISIDIVTPSNEDNEENKKLIHKKVLDVNRDGVIDDSDLVQLGKYALNQTEEYVNDVTVLSSDKSENSLLVLQGDYPKGFGVPIERYNQESWMVNEHFISYLLGINLTKFSKGDDISYIYKLINSVYPQAKLKASGIYSEDLQGYLLNFQCLNNLEYALGYLDTESEKLLIEGAGDTL